MRNSRMLCSRLGPLDDVFGHCGDCRVVVCIRPSCRHEDHCKNVRMRSLVLSNENLLTEQRLILVNAQRISATSFHKLNGIGGKWVTDEVRSEAFNSLDCSDFFAKNLQSFGKYFARRQDAQGIKQMSTIGQPK